MSTQIDKQQIFDFCKSYKEYENFVEKANSLDSIFKGIGFLIENDLIKNWKISIFYEQLKNNLTSDFSQMEKMIKAPVNKVDIFQNKFDNSQQLKNDIFNNKEYILITQPLWEKICNPNCKSEKGIDYKIIDNKISFIFNEKDKLEFKINNFIINNSTLISNEKNLTNKGTEKKNENNNININNSQNQENKDCINKVGNNINKIDNQEKFNNESNPFLKADNNEYNQVNLSLQKSLSSPNGGLNFNINKNQNLNNENNKDQFNLQLKNIKSENLNNNIIKQDSGASVNNSLIRKELNESTKKDLLALINYYKFKTDLKKKIIIAKDGKFEEMNIYHRKYLFNYIDIFMIFKSLNINYEFIISSE